MADATTQSIVIIGAGQAGGGCAVELRKRGFEGWITLVGDEPYMPYKRPPLSKGYLAGEAALDSLYLMQAPNLDKAGIDCRPGLRATAIDPTGRRVTLDDGSQLEYNQLVLATGGRARRLPLPGADAANVFLLRTIADVDRIKAQCQPGRRVVIVGGGFIGLEAAAVACKLGLQVTVLEQQERVLSRVTSPEVSEFFERLHQQAGVDVRTQASVATFEPAGEGLQVTLACGERIAADFIIVGVGLVPNTELAEQAGLAVDDGIVVDEFTRSSDPNIHAIGDCCNHPNALVGGRLRLESVQNAMEQGRVAAANLAGRETAYQSVPWFWSDQYDVKLQMAGISAGHEQRVLRGDPNSHAFSVFYLREQRLVAADAINRPKDFMLAKKLVASDCRPSLDKLADDSIPLKTLL